MPSRLPLLAALLLLAASASGCLSGGEEEPGRDRGRVDRDRAETDGQPSDDGDGSGSTSDDGVPSQDDPSTPGNVTVPGMTGNGTGTDDVNGTDGGNATDPPPDGEGPPQEGGPGEDAGNETAGPVQPMQPPPVAVGSWWNYAVSSPDVQITTEVRVEAVEERPEGSSHRWKTYQVATFTGSTITKDTTSWQTVDSGGWTDLVTDTTMDTPWGEFSTMSRKRYEPPCPEYVWPLQVGLAWQRSCFYTYEDEGSGGYDTRLTNYTVVDFGPVETAAGVFHAFKVQLETEGRVVYEYLAEEACGVVLSTRSDGGIVKELQSYSC